MPIDKRNDDLIGAAGSDTVVPLTNNWLRKV